jgi:hypothetical protein
MTGLVLAALLQAGAPTVGDTTWLRRTVTAPAASGIEPRRLEGRAGEFDVLGPPVVTREGARAVLRWPVVFWTTGRHEVELPAVLVTSGEGVVDSEPPAPALVEVASVLPAGARDSLLAPQPPVAVLPVRRRSWWPALAALLAAGAGGYLLWRGWTRRGASRAPPAGAGTVPPPVVRWAESGEARAVAHAAAARLRRAVATAHPPAHEALDTEQCLRLLADDRPAWPLDEVGRCLRQLDLLRFGPDEGVGDPLRLWHEADVLAGRVEAAAP